MIDSILGNNQNDTSDSLASINSLLHAIVSTCLETNTSRFAETRIICQGDIVQINCNFLVFLRIYSISLRI